MIHLQETNLSNNQHEKRKNIGFRNTLYSYFKESNKRGEAILI